MIVSITYCSKCGFLRRIINKKYGLCQICNHLRLHPGGSTIRGKAHKEGAEKPQVKRSTLNKGKIRPWKNDAPKGLKTNNYKRYSEGEIRRKIKKGSRKQLMKEADRLFSLLIRQSNSKDGMCECMTCGKMYPWRGIQCGHYMSRRHLSTRFDRMNCAPQCVRCNILSSGRQADFGDKIDKIYRIGMAEKLKLKSKMKSKLTTTDLRWMIEEYKKELLERDFEAK